ncbi:molecular chaperone HtpG [Coralliovum pocilloporae]|uniref:molecular chaperone HtpG n=1 Tax=Coralliovum pocilloporae TaxID=3066369 RepID=UPI003307B5B8
MSEAETANTGEKHEFGAEVSRLLHLMVHAVYSNKDIFLRELVSNAADACEKLRHMALNDATIAGEAPGFQIEIDAEKDSGRLVITDNGIGMSHDELIDNLGTIARSGTKAFLDNLDGSDASSALIGQFGVGFYSAFMVADLVHVTSRRAGSDEAWQWVSDGKGTYTVNAIALDDAPERGTRIELFLNEDNKAYAEEDTIRRIVREYSAHVPVPILLKKDDADEPDQLADGTALWTRSKSDVTDEEYKEFYGHVSGQFDDPAVTVHYRAEGRHEYTVLLFVPGMKPFDLFDPDRKGRVKLYVRRVFITDDAGLLPAWLRFVRGVVDSEDLPLNISREMLQDNPILTSIRGAVTKRILSELEKLAKSDEESFLKIWDAFGPVIKEGLYEDPERRDAIFKLARFKTTKSGEGWRSLSDYVADLKENQTALYYATGTDVDAIRTSPHLEGYQARDVEVLLLSDPVDSFWVQTALGFEGKPFKSVTQGASDIESIAKDETDTSDEDKAAEGEMASLITEFKRILGDAVGDVRSSPRLATSAVCLVAPDFGPDKQFEKLMSQQQGLPSMAPVLELNPSHALIRGLAQKADAKDTALLEDAAPLLLGQARILDGEAPANPSDFVRRLGELMQKGLGL